MVSGISEGILDLVRFLFQIGMENIAKHGQRQIVDDCCALEIAQSVFLPILTLLKINCEVSLGQPHPNLDQGVPSNPTAFPRHDTCTLITTHACTMIMVNA